jgi:hypothetical protein
VFTLNSNDEEAAPRPEPRTSENEHPNFDVSRTTLFSKEDMRGLNCVCLRFVDLVGTCEDGEDFTSNIYASERVLCLMTVDNQFPVHIAMLE